MSRHLAASEMNLMASQLLARVLGNKLHSSCLPPTLVGGLGDALVIPKPALAGLVIHLSKPAEAGCNTW